MVERRIPSYTVYVYIKGDKENRDRKSEIFFWTYNPHGKNEFSAYNSYEFVNL